VTFVWLYLQLYLFNATPDPGPRVLRWRRTIHRLVPDPVFQSLFVSLVLNRLATRRLLACQLINIIGCSLYSTLRHDWSTDVGVLTTSCRFCVIFTGWVPERVAYKLAMTIGVYMAWHRRNCAPACNLSHNCIGASCVLQRPMPLLFQQPDSLLSVTVPIQSLAIAYGTVCQPTSHQ